MQWGELENLSPEPFVIPIQIDLKGKLISAEFRICFDPHILRFKAIELSKPMKDFQVEYHLNPGKLNVALAGAQSITSIDELARIKFETVEQEAASQTIIKFNGME